MIIRGNVLVVVVYVISLSHYVVLPEFMNEVCVVDFVKVIISSEDAHTLFPSGSTIMLTSLSNVSCSFQQIF